MLKRKFFPTKFSAVQSLSHVQLLWPHKLQHTKFPCPLPIPRACSDSCPLSRWCHPTISSSVITFSSCLQSSQHQGLFQWVSSSHQVARVLQLQLQHKTGVPCLSATFLSPLLFLPPYSSFNLCFMEKRNQEMWMSLKHVETQERMDQNIKLMS